MQMRIVQNVYAQSIEISLRFYSGQVTSQIHPLEQNTPRSPPGLNAKTLNIQQSKVDHLHRVASKITSTS